MEVTGPAGVPPQAAGGVARRFRLASPAAAAALGAVMLVLAAASIVLAALSGQLRISSIGPPVVISIYAVVGIVVARHQPRNPEGWVLLTAALLFVLSGEAGSYAVLRYHLGHAGLPFAQVAVLLVPLWVPAAALFPVVILLFPDGVLTRRWRRALWTYAVLVACAAASALAPAIAAVTRGDIRIDSFGDAANAGYPGSAAVSAVQPVVALLIGVFWLAFIARPFFTWRRAGGVRRQQLKWLACGGSATIVLGFLGSAFNASVAGKVLFGVGAAALPVSIGVGILKYRLYEIDRIISRTLAYAILTGLLVGVYAGLVLLATQVFRFHSTVAVAAATLAAAALFSPLRRRVQRAVDRRFNRARYDAERTVAAFAARLKDAVDLDSVRDDLAGVVQQVLEPAHLSVWMSRRD